MVKYLGPCTYQQIFFKIYTNTFFNFGLKYLCSKTMFENAKILIL